MTSFQQCKENLREHENVCILFFWIFIFVCLNRRQDGEIGDFCIFFQEIIFRYEYLVKRPGKHYFQNFAMASLSLWEGGYGVRKN